MFLKYILILRKIINIRNSTMSVMVVVKWNYLNQYSVHCFRIE